MSTLDIVLGCIVSGVTLFGLTGMFMFGARR